MTTITLVRHGLSTWNAEGRAQGHCDAPLHSTGRKQARCVAKRLVETPWNAFYSSDLPRAKETAEIIVKEFGQHTISEDARLREVDCGELIGLTLEERIERWGDNWRSLALGRESSEDAGNRGVEAIEMIRARHPGEQILVVSHGAVLRHTLQRLVEGLFLATPLGNTSLTTIHHDGHKWSCTLMDCTVHLNEPNEMR
ncbi:histidine phosphatase family protein [Aureibacillus halotolerans]|uniref:Putative phosphoglycerate mutase n=1 Tax=Aureibacillus halotolerans TaxID=1508390 RepID=A0A4R6TUJ6_9BACI|nr:histidine phosphatase family protein [Aureibacillus halotolerans]TDQ37410.1 putative phosphoglycerate mutase [Aureibacillus halotolerans]